MCERVSIAEAARELGISIPAVREGMRRGVLRIGDVISPSISGKKRYQFRVYRAKLDKHLGKEDVRVAEERKGE